MLRNVTIQGLRLKFSNVKFYNKIKTTHLHSHSKIMAEGSRTALNNNNGIVGANNVISFLKGHPDRKCIENCSDMLHKASLDIIESEQLRCSAVLYGHYSGSQEYKDELAIFLSQQYGDLVKSECLFLTTGAGVGLHLVASLLFSTSHPVFTEDPSYYWAYNILSKDIANKLTPVTLEDDGINIHELDTRLTEQCAGLEVSERYPWKGLVYLIPVFHNPTGVVYSPEKCRALVNLAIKHRVLIVCDDVYNLLSYDFLPPPPRLLSYDNSTNDVGHVVSVGSFTKYFSPGIRLGWIEARPAVMDRLTSMGMIRNGGSLNHYVSTLMVQVMRRGLLSQHLNLLRSTYKEKKEAITSSLSANLPSNCQHSIVKGGYFVWLELPANVNAVEFSNYCKQMHGVTFFDGSNCSVIGNFTNCIRLCFIERSVDEIHTGVERLCVAIKAYTMKDPKSLA